MPNFTCDVEDCNGIPKTGLHCEMHRRRNTVYGTPETKANLIAEYEKSYKYNRPFKEGQNGT